MVTWLRAEEHVHHIDENKLNNSPSNLQVLSNVEHAKLHHPASDYSSDNRTVEEYKCEYCSIGFHPFRASKHKRFCSHSCYFEHSIKNKELTKELLDELIPKTSWRALGEMFGYSDNGIKKRAKALGCDISKARYKHSN